jgi:hypothetical protein
VAANDEEENVLVDQELRFLTARNGDHLVTRFQCDGCQFLNVYGRLPDKNLTDVRCMKFIRRAKLDAFWSREPTTIESNHRTFDKAIQCWKFLSLSADDVLPRLGPFPIKDNQGYGLAIPLLVCSLDPGKNEEKIQFESVRKMRSVFSNVWHVRTEGLKGSTAIRGQTKLISTESPTNQDWYERFMLGMHK